jgi:hypothetical protein
VKILLDGEEDGQRVERVDADVGQGRVGAEVLPGNVLFFPYQLDQFLLDLRACHPAAIIACVRRRLWLLYPLWIVFCAGLFFALRNSDDPSRRHDRILSNDAAVRAVAILRSRDGVRFAVYEAVHVAYAGRGEAGGRARWIVLCDRIPHSALRDAVVVELDARDGSLLAIRKPVN